MNTLSKKEITAIGEVLSKLGKAINRFEGKDEINAYGDFSVGINKPCIVSKVRLVMPNYEYYPLASLTLFVNFKGGEIDAADMGTINAYINEVEKLADAPVEDIKRTAYENTTEKIKKNLGLC